jgi:hypothetical protein
MPPLVRWPAPDIVRSVRWHPRTLGKQMGEKSDGKKGGNDIYLLC